MVATGPLEPALLPEMHSNGSLSKVKGSALAIGFTADDFLHWQGGRDVGSLLVTCLESALEPGDSLEIVFHPRKDSLAWRLGRAARDCMTKGGALRSLVDAVRTPSKMDDLKRTFGDGGRRRFRPWASVGRFDVVGP